MSDPTASPSSTPLNIAHNDPASSEHQQQQPPPPSSDPFAPRPLSRLSMASAASARAQHTHSPSSLHQHPCNHDALSGSSSGSRIPDTQPHHHVDDDDDDDDDDDQDGFVPRRRQKQSSILPSAAFFAPKKPNARIGAVSPVPQHRSRSPFFQLDHHQQHHPDAAAAAATAMITTTAAANDSSLSLGGGDVGTARGIRSSSPWGFAPSVHSLSSSYRQIDGRRKSDAVTDAAAAIKTLKMASSTDPLLPAAAIRGAKAQPPPHSSFSSSSRTPADLASPADIFQALAAPGLRAYEEQSYTLRSDKAYLRGGGGGGGLDRPASRRQSALLAAGQQGSSAARRISSSNPNDNNVAIDMPSAVPASHPPSHRHRKRNYQLHGGSNRFFCGGLVMTSGGNPLAFLGSLALILILGGLFFGFEASWLIDNISPAVVAVFAYVYLLTLVNMLVTAWKDPGVVPRDLDPDPPCTLDEANGGGGVSSQPFADPGDPLAIPVQRVIRVRGEDVRVKWCETCGTYRPPRSSHCRVCDNCIENIDHHCDFLNTCIGRRNYVSFMVFLAAAIVSSLMVLAWTTVHLVLLTRPSNYTFPRNCGERVGPNKTFAQALGDTPVSAVLFLLTLATIGPVTTLFVYHVRLILLNRTTVEQIRISTTRELGEKKYDEYQDDVDSINDRGRTNPVTMYWWAMLGFCGMKKDDGGRREKDPNPFGTKKWGKNVRNGMGWRSVHLESWMDRRKWARQDTRTNSALEFAPSR